MAENCCRYHYDCGGIYGCIQAEQFTAEWELTMAEKKKIMELKSITKEFFKNKALDNVSIDVYENEILAICGENGAGKSTLMKLLVERIRIKSMRVRFILTQNCKNLRNRLILLRQG